MLFSQLFGMHSFDPHGLSSGLLSGASPVPYGNDSITRQAPASFLPFAMPESRMPDQASPFGGVASPVPYGNDSITRQAPLSFPTAPAHSLPATPLFPTPTFPTPTSPGFGLASPVPYGRDSITRQAPSFPSFPMAQGTRPRDFLTNLGGWFPSVSRATNSRMLQGNIFPNLNLQRANFGLGATQMAPRQNLAGAAMLPENMDPQRIAQLMAYIASTQRAFGNQQPAVGRGTFESFLASLYRGLGGAFGNGIAGI